MNKEKVLFNNNNNNKNEEDDDDDIIINVGMEFPNENWEPCFESALGSMVVARDNIICNSGADENSPQYSYNNDTTAITATTTTYYYTTPLNSPPKFNHLMMSEPTYSCLGGQTTQFEEPSMTSALANKGSSDVSNGGKKRKENEDEEEENDTNNKNKSKKKKKEEAAPKLDYIHVRARRGQATDSHSLAERVRREKIGERMKFLQDLVPGCNKVIGKAVMLDEIINYVQSLQRQVEFLSMKLATVNPRMELNAEALLRKDIRAASLIAQNIYPALENTYPYGDCGVYQSAAQQRGEGGFGLSSSLMNSSPHLLLNPFQNICPLSDAATPQSSAFWGDDLHTIVYMGFGHDLPQTYDTGIGHMKVEL